MKKGLLIFLALAASLNSYASSKIEESIYSILKNSGAYVEYRHTTADVTGEITLESLYCNQLRGADSFDCSYVDLARPRELAKILGDDAETLFKELVASGVKTSYAFGIEVLNVQYLRCRNQKITENGDSRFNCERLRPLLNF